MGANDRTINQLKRNAEQVAAIEERLAKAKLVQDGLVKDARQADISYNDIAAAIGKSYSWINASLARSGGVRPRAGRPRRAETVSS